MVRTRCSDTRAGTEFRWNIAVEKGTRSWASVYRCAPIYKIWRNGSPANGADPLESYFARNLFFNGETSYETTESTAFWIRIEDRKVSTDAASICVIGRKGRGYGETGWIGAIALRRYRDGLYSISGSFCLWCFMATVSPDLGFGATSLQINRL